jgi:hypothetical protein
MHAGFESALRVVWPALQVALAGASPGGRLLFTGHSLGAAIAVLAARRASAVAAVDGVYTFGMPRCGGRAFAEAYEAALGARTYRFVNGHDIVPTVPPSGFGYRHVGRSLLCRHGAAFDAAAPLPAAPTDDPPLAQTVVDGIRSGIRNLWRRDLPPPVQPGRLGKLYTFLPPGIGDHLPARYLHALGALAEDAAT